MIKVLLVDDENMIRQGIGYVIKMQKDMKLIGEAGDGKTALDIALMEKPDVVLMDVQMPICSGIEATREIVKSVKGVKVIILTTFDIEEYVYEAIRAGAVGYFLKDGDLEDMLEAIRGVYKGEAVYKTGMASKAISDVLLEKCSTQVLNSDKKLELLESLTEREKDVLQQMSFGLRNEQIAEVLFITEGTVKTHIHKLLQKLGAADRTQAVVIALRNGLVK
jgi:DNA-binding NarL/FixJ family response regulator